MGGGGIEFHTSGLSPEEVESRGGWNRKSKSHDLRARFLQAGSYWLPRQEFAGLFLEIWTLLANFAVPSEGPRQVGYKKYFDLRARFLQAGSYWLPRQEFAGLFLEIWTLLANFAVPSEGPRQVGYKKYFILPGLFCPGE